MSRLDAKLIRRSLSAQAGARLDELDVFGSIASTNTYLMAQPSPAPGRFRAALADHQTSGRGRHYRRWVSPPGAGLALSLAYTFENQPDDLPSLTLAIGVGVIDALRGLGIDGIGLKWPNDIVALGGKLGGVLTERQSRAGNAVTIVTGLGLNIALPSTMDLGPESDGSRAIVDISKLMDKVPSHAAIAVAAIDGLIGTVRKFDALGFVGFRDAWASNDWLLGKQVTVDMPDKQLTGIAAGVDTDGALLIDTGMEKTRVVSGSIVMAGHARPHR